MSEELRKALEDLLGKASETSDQRYTILVDMLWKAARGDWHGVSDAANDLRELGL